MSSTYRFYLLLVGANEIHVIKREVKRPRICEWELRCAELSEHRQSSFFLNEVCQITNLQKLFVMVNKSANAYFSVFMNKFFHLLM